MPNKPPILTDMGTQVAAKILLRIQVLGYTTWPITATERSPLDRTSATRTDIVQADLRSRPQSHSPSFLHPVTPSTGTGCQLAKSAGRDYERILRRRPYNLHQPASNPSQEALALDPYIFVISQFSQGRSPPTSSLSDDCLYRPAAFCAGRI